MVISSGFQGYMMRLVYDPICVKALLTQFSHCEITTSDIMLKMKTAVNL